MTSHSAFAMAGCWNKVRILEPKVILCDSDRFEKNCLGEKSAKHAGYEFESTWLISVASCLGDYFVGGGEHVRSPMILFMFTVFGRFDGMNS